MAMFSLQNRDRITKFIENLMVEITPNRLLSVAQAVEEFFVAKKAERISPNTVADYSLTLRRFMEHIGADYPICHVTAHQIQEFLGGLNVSKKTVLNAHIALCSLWTWAVENEVCLIHIPRRVKPPRPEKRVIVPYSRPEIDHFLEDPLQPYAHNRALLLVLLDTGVRASEVGALAIRDLRRGQFKVFGKGAKERLVPVSDTTVQAIEQYLAIRRPRSNREPVFTNFAGKAMDRHCLRKYLLRLGEHAGVHKVHAHRFRHTFAINYIRNGGDTESLRIILGHSTLEMVKIYAQLAKEDVELIHRRASPVENWGLSPD